MLKKSALSLLLLFAVQAFSQTNAVELRNHTTAQATIDLLNKKKAGDIYALFDSNMQKSMGKDVWLSAAQAQLYPLVPISKVDFLSFNGSASFYTLATASNRWTMQIATNKDNLMSMLFFSPLKSEIIAGTNQMIAGDKKTDEQAQLILAYFNKKNTDSIYALTNAAFQKQVSKEVLMQSFEAQLFPYGPITNFQFIKSTNNVNKYKAEIGTITLQMLVGLDKEGKVGTFAMQPYKEDGGVKRTEVWHDNALLTPTDSLVHGIAKKYMESTKTPAMSIGILQGTKAFYYNYGEVRLHADQHPLRTTLYEIGSISKTFTAFILADAVSTGKVKLSDPVTKYLPASVAANKNLQAVTLEQLANHTSGLPRLPGNLAEGMKNTLDPYADYDTTKLYSYLAGFAAQRKPGEKYEYSNLAFGLLGTIMERVYQQPLEQLYQQLICKPFKMTATYSSNITDSSIVAAGYNEKGDPTPYWNFSSLAGCGAIKSNTEDLLKYALQFTLKPRTKGKTDPRVDLLENITYQQSPMFVSLGWHFDKADTAARTMQHSGGTYGFRSNLSIYPDKKLAIAVLCNSGEEPGAPIVADELKKKILALKQ